MSRVDVVIPCYKYAHFLRECVTSVLAQEGVGVRVLIIDDCSPDDTPAVARELLREDARVQYRRHEQNRGHIATYNEGLLEWASADYSLLLSADDLLSPGALLRSTRLMDQHPEIGFTYGRAIKTRTPHLAATDVQLTGDSRVRSGRDYLEEICTTGQNPVDTPTALVRTDLQQRIGGYKRELPHAADMELWLRFALNGSVGYIESVQALYRIHGTNMSVEYNNLRDFQERERVFKHFYDSAMAARPDDAAEWEKLYRLSREGLADQAFWTAGRLFDLGRSKEWRDYLTFAAAVNPNLPRSSKWWRMRVKGMMGEKLWGLIAPASRRVRGLPAHRGAEEANWTGPCW